MAANLVTCLLCCHTYDQNLHLPKVLGCSHTFCLACLLQTFQSYNSIPCVDCKATEKRTRVELPTNPTIIGLLDLTSLKCVVHNTPATSFCCAHYVPVCDQCSHPNCEQADALEYNRIAAKVLPRIDAVWSQIEKLGVPSAPELLYAVQKKYENKLQENVDLLQKLTGRLESFKQLSCMKCGGRGELVFDRRTLEVHCSQCVVERDPSEVLDVSDSLMLEVC